LPFIDDAPFWPNMPPLKVEALPPALNVGALLPAPKLKAFAEGGWGLKPLLWLLLPAPNDGNEPFEKALVGAGCCVGGKLLVAPKALLLAPNMPPFVLLLLLVSPPTAGAGDDAPKPKPPVCGDAPKPAPPSEGVCAYVLACCRAICSLRIWARPAGVL